MRSARLPVQHSDWHLEAPGLSSESGLASPVIRASRNVEERKVRNSFAIEYTTSELPISELLGFFDCIFPTNDTTRARRMHIIALANNAVAGALTVFVVL